jgi:hypothetical protein
MTALGGNAVLVISRLFRSEKPRERRCACCWRWCWGYTPVR